MNWTTRFFIYAPFALFVILAVGVGAFWWSTADRLSARLDGWNGHEIMPGVTLHFGSKTIAGFPFSLDTVFKDFELDVDTPHGPVKWRAPDFAMHALTYGRDETIFEAAGVQHLDWTGLDGKPHDFVFAPGSLHASAIKDGGGLSRFDLVIAAFGSPALTASDVQFHMRRTPGADSVDVFVSTSDVHLSPALRSDFGSVISHAALQATLGPEKPLDALRAGNQAWPDAADAWRMAGGSIRVDMLEVAFGRLDAIGKGALTLDESKRPNGILDFRIAGFSHFVDQMHSRGTNGTGLAAALMDRAAKAGSNDSGEMGVLIGAKGGIAYAGDEPVGPLDPLY